MSTSSNITHRTLHLVDLENLVGDPHADADPALETLAEYLELADGKRAITSSWPRTRGS